MNDRPQLAAARTPAEIQRSGALVAKEAGGSTVADFFQANRDSIKAVLPSHMTPDRMLKIALRALRTTPKLLECTINSLFGAVVTCAQLGLEPNTPQGHIYLIPFENKRKAIFEVQVIVGYKGLVDLARRSGEIVSISSHAVMRNDTFDVSFGTDESIVHKPRLDGDRGDIVGFYAVAKLVGGGTQFEFMSTTDVNKIRDGSQGYKTAIRFNKQDTPWISSYEQMGRKTVIRRLCNYLPMSIEMAGAIALEGRAERNEAQGLDQVLNGDYHVMPESEVETTFDPETGEIADNDGGQSDARSNEATAQDETRQQRKPRSDAGKPRGPRGSQQAAQPAEEEEREGTDYGDETVQVDSRDPHSASSQAQQNQQPAQRRPTQAQELDI